MEGSEIIMKLTNICSACNGSLTNQEMCTSEDMYGSSIKTDEGRTVWFVSICCGAEVLEEWRDEDDIQ